MATDIRPNFKEIHKKFRSLLNVQFQEFYRQIKERTISPETMLDNWDEDHDFLEEILLKNSEKEELEISDYLDSIGALFMLAFLDKLDNDFPEDEEGDDDL